MIKAFSKVSKQLLLDLCKSKYLSEKELSAQPEYCDFRKCKSSCPWFFENKNICKVCKTCPFVLSTSSIRIARKDALTFTQIKQLLLYHFLILNNDGLTPLIDHEFVANKINCSVKTARKNITSLNEAGFILARSDKSTYKAYIINYNSYHKDERGYLQINRKLLNAILNTSDINELRLALYCIVKLDDMRVAFNKGKKKNFKNVFKKYVNAPKKKFTYESLLNILPSYIYSKQQLISILKKISDCLSIFNIQFEEEHIIITETNTGNVFFTKLLEKTLNGNIKVFINKFNFIFNSEEINDIIQMMVQYGTAIMGKALKIYKQRLNDKEDLLTTKIHTDSDDIIPVTNVGGYIRTIIQEEITYNLSLV